MTEMRYIQLTIVFVTKKIGLENKIHLKMQSYYLFIFILMTSTVVLATPLVKRQSSTSSTGGGDGEVEVLSDRNKDPAGDLLRGLSGLFGAAMDGLASLIQLKQEIIMPAIERTVDVGRSVVESPVVGRIVDTASDAVGTLVQKGPAIAKSVGTVVSGAGEATNGLLKTGLCNFVCPMQKDCVPMQVQ